MVYHRKLERERVYFVRNPYLEKAALQMFDGAQRFDATEVRALVDHAAEQGDQRAQLWQKFFFAKGMFHCYGEPLERLLVDFEQLREYTRPEDLSTRFLIALCLIDGIGTKASKEGLQLLEDLAKGGMPIAQVTLAKGYEAKGPSHGQAALKYFKLAADQGYADGQFMVGSVYDAGVLVPRDQKAAAKWYLLAAKQGHGQAQAQLGRLYELGLGVARNDVEAVRWYRAAAEQRLSMAQLALAKMTATGRGLDRDLKQAAVWFRLAAELGEAEAQFELGKLYRAGTGVPEHLDAALTWITAAAMNQYEPACLELGAMYETGQGVPHEPADAAEWYAYASHFGGKMAHARLRKLGKSLVASATAVPQGDEDAALAQALAWHWGSAGTVDVVKAKLLLDRVAATGHPRALLWQALFLAEGAAGYPQQRAKGKALALASFDQVYNDIAQADQPTRFLVASCMALQLGGERGSAEGFRRLNALAQEGMAAAKDQLGYMCEYGMYIERDQKQAAKWYQAAVDQGFLPAAAHLAQLYDVQEDAEQALPLAKVAAEGGVAAAQFIMGQYSEEGNQLPEDPQVGLSWYRLAAGQDHVPSLTILGQKYEEGSGVGRDETVALSYFLRAAKLGVAACSVIIGDRYQQRNQPYAAADFYRHAALRGSADGAYQLGLLYLSKAPGYDDPEAAVRWFHLAYICGSTEARNAIGQAYLGGLGVVKDPDEAMKWFLLAADAGDVDAQFRLGEMFEQGQGKIYDLILAKAWYKRAAREGHQFAQEGLTRLARVR